MLNNAPVGKITRDDLISFIDNMVKRNSEKNFKALETLVKLGLQKIVVDTGSIESKLTFHINAIDSKILTRTILAVVRMHLMFQLVLNLDGLVLRQITSIIV